MTRFFNLLKKTHIFRSLPDTDLQRIESTCRRKDFDRGDIIFAEGSPGHHFYIIIRGEVEIWKSYGSPARDLLAICVKGHAFGELALIDDSPRSATAVARGRCSLLVIERSEFLQVLQDSPPLSFSMMQSLSQMIRERTDTYVANLREKNRKLESAYERLKREIGARRQVRKELDDRITCDPLTGLPNRPAFLAHLQMTMSRARQEQKYDYTVSCVDIDRFSAVNESMGYRAGDDILSALARRMRPRFGKNAILARFSGDSFALLLPDGGTAAAVQAAGQIQEMLQEPFVISDREIFITVSTGIATGRSGYNSGVDILRDADIAMYEAKTDGQGQYRIYDPVRHGKTLDLLELETDLRRAVEKWEFTLEYQPIVRLTTGEIAGFEALVRWIHPERGRIGPDIFIPIAEKTGQIVPLGSRILKEACAQMQAWSGLISNSAPVFVSVNISARQMVQADFMTQFRETLRETGLAGRFLKVEITESVLIENVDYFLKVLKEIRETGVRIALDDFGTGYSSLSYLYKFPIDVLKIDRAFVTRMGIENAKDLVPVIISIAHSMNMDVVAEGVETLDQAEQLRMLGCEYGQGFLFSKSLTPAAVFRLIIIGGYDWCRIARSD